MVTGQVNQSNAFDADSDAAMYRRTARKAKTVELPHWLTSSQPSTKLLLNQRQLNQRQSVAQPAQARLALPNLVAPNSTAQQVVPLSQPSSDASVAKAAPARTPVVSVVTSKTATSETAPSETPASEIANIANIATSANTATNTATNAATVEPVSPSDHSTASNSANPLGAGSETGVAASSIASNLEKQAKFRLGAMATSFSDIVTAIDRSSITASTVTATVTSTVQTLRRFRLSRWSVLCTGTLGLFGGVGLMAYLWLASLPPLPNCQEITPLSPDSHRLYCAQEVARSGKLEDLQAGIELVKDWQPGHPLYRDAQNALAKWSRLVVLVARDKVNQNDLKGAIEAVNTIPQSSPAYEEAQKTLAEWKAQWQEGEAIYAKALEAVKQQNWKAAFDQVTELGYLEHDYWRLQQADVLAKQILVQKESYEALRQAKKLAKKLFPEQMGEAIALLQTVSPESDMAAEAQQLSTTWSQNLLKIALQYWRDGGTSRAVELAQQIPLSLKLSGEGQDLVKFSHAHQLVADSNIEAKLSWRQIWNLSEATAGMSQIPPDSPIYAEAQARLADWQAQLADLKQLQVATTLADLRQKPMLEAAIAQAGKIAPDRQRYAQAQNLIATWRHQIEQLEDLPYLQRAQQFASTSLIPDLQLAIAQAQVIPNHRSIWAEVQTQVVAWQRQIEMIEDQPIMDKAEALAKANKLDEAINAAAEVRPNRALYEQAQTAIATWKDKMRQIEVAKDRAVMDQAYSFAGGGQLTEGIATAAQISPGRPLYLEAQAAIGAWLRERDGMKPDAGDAPSLGSESDGAATLPESDPSGSHASSSDASNAPAADSGANASDSDAESGGETTEQ